MDMEVISKAKEYVAWDINSETRNQVEEMIHNNDISLLHRILDGRLVFGTAGLRGPMGPGYCCMNELVILQTCQGICVYLEAQLGSAIKKQGIVIGYDHRKFGTITSLSIARISAAVFLSKGFKVYLLENFVPTPFVAFGVTHFNAVAGIMVTASHNPKRDNGFKIYWNNGCQIIPPHDSGIAQKINENLQPWSQYDIASVLTHPNATDVTTNTAEAYFQALKRLSYTPVPSSSLIITYTAMHGVGSPWIKKAFEVYGHAQPIYVSEQKDPDPEFSTVKFPNPEEKGALDLAMSVADKNGSRMIIANDPDADRLALAEYVNNVSSSSAASASSEGKWYVYSGNEIGDILGHYQIMRWKLKRALGLPVKSNAAVLTSVVSSRMLRAMALAEGIVYCDTLTGFKWIGNRSVQLQQGSESMEPLDVVFSYEEALGYCVGDAVADKDGISAAVVVAELAHTIYVGQLPGVSSIYDYLQSLYRLYGKFVSYNSYYFSYNPDTTNIIFHELRHADSNDIDKIHYGKSYGNVEVRSIKDVTLGYDSTTSDHSSDLPATPDSHMIMYEFVNGCSLTLRTSGTEPKIKFYTEMTSKSSYDNVSSSSSSDAIGSPSDSELIQTLKDFVDKAVNEMLQPMKYGLTKP